MFICARFSVLMVLCLSGLGENAPAQSGRKATELPTFRKHVLLDGFVAEGVATGDVNGDGKTDVMAGPYWFEGPDWKKKHEIFSPQLFATVKYSDSFVSQGMDVNLDGWVDLVRIGFPGQAAVWHENPKNADGNWKTHLIHPTVGNESAGFADVDGDGRLDLIGSSSDVGQMTWFRAPTTPGATEWQRFPISGEKAPGTAKFAHGLGLGDLNGDGRADLLTKTGWWEAPPDRKTPNWVFHEADLGEDCAQMYAYDVDGDGDNDVVASSAHRYGIWWHEQAKDAQGNTHWNHYSIHQKFSQTHGLLLLDMNGDGPPDLVTGKRYFAHNGKTDPGELEPPVLYWFEFKPGKSPVWIPHQVDDDSGVGVQVVAEDVTKDGSMDIVVANKKGVFVFEQQRSGREKRIGADNRK